MKLGVITNDALKTEFLAKPINSGVLVEFTNEPAGLPADADVIFDLLFTANDERVKALAEFLPRPVFVSEPLLTLKELSAQFIRINAWPTFLERSITELVASPGQIKTVSEVFEAMGWKYQLVPDIPGMISPRIAAMIINEAYLLLDNKVSSKEEIDVAMKTGTNYPYGPFEWSKKIGPDSICELIKVINKNNSLYEVATSLTYNSI